MFCKTKEQVSDGSNGAELFACPDDAAPVLGAEALKIGSHEHSSAARDDCAELGVLFVALSENSVEGVEPVDCQKPENLIFKIYFRYRF
jgi:hypothetical protein